MGSEQATISPADTHRLVWQRGEHAQRLDQHRIQSGMVGEGCPGAGGRGGRGGVEQGSREVVQGRSSLSSATKAGLRRGFLLGEFSKVPCYDVP